jgi:hypothetical protein
MNAFSPVRLLAAILIAGVLSSQGFASQPVSTSKTGNSAANRDGQHDFDFEIGTWKTHVSRLQHPLTGSRVWLEYDGYWIATDTRIKGVAGHAG